MTVATTLATGYSRTVPLHDSDTHQTCDQIALDAVPEMPGSAVVVDVTPRSIRYEDGQHAWWVDTRDKTIIRAYRERRRDQDIKAGAFPARVTYFDEKGPL
jgi:hypothetical protein